MFKRAIVVLLVLCSILSAPFSTPAPTEARDSNCTREVLSTKKTFQKYIVVGGWGWTNWAVHVGVEVYDRCSHGAVSVTVSLVDPVVEQKGGNVYISGVWYWLGSQERWVQMSQGSGINDTYSYTGGIHVDMAYNERVTYIYVATAAWVKQDASGWVGLATANVMCDLKAVKCST